MAFCDLGIPWKKRTKNIASEYSSRESSRNKTPNSRCIRPKTISSTGNKRWACSDTMRPPASQMFSQLHWYWFLSPPRVRLSPSSTDISWRWFQNGPFSAPMRYSFEGIIGPFDRTTLLWRSWMFFICFVYSIDGELNLILCCKVYWFNSRTIRCLRNQTMCELVHMIINLGTSDYTCGHYRVAESYSGAGISTNPRSGR